MGDIEQHKPHASHGNEAFAVRIAKHIGDVSRADWDACAGAGPTPFATWSDNPFISHDFLTALEDSGSAAPSTGWLPHHLVFEDRSGAVLGCMPCYLKSHSLGEYVFDHGWAEAYDTAGGRYYPKLQASIPFTPVSGRRLLVRAGEDRAAHQAVLLQAEIGRAHV